MEYDCGTDRCDGLVLPLNNGGLPVIDAFLTVSFPDMENIRKVSVTKYAMSTWHNLCGSMCHHFAWHDLAPIKSFVQKICCQGGNTSQMNMLRAALQY